MLTNNPPNNSTSQVNRSSVSNTNASNSEGSTIQKASTSPPINSGKPAKISLFARVAAKLTGSSQSLQKNSSLKEIKSLYSSTDRLSKQLNKVAAKGIKGGGSAETLSFLKDEKKQTKLHGFMQSFIQDAQRDGASEKNILKAFSHVLKNLPIEMRRSEEANFMQLLHPSNSTKGATEIPSKGPEQTSTTTALTQPKSRPGPRTPTAAGNLVQQKNVENRQALHDLKNMPAKEFSSKQIQYVAGNLLSKFYEGTSLKKLESEYLEGKDSSTKEFKSQTMALRAALRNTHLRNFLNDLVKEEIVQKMTSKAGSAPIEDELPKPPE